MVLWAKLLYGNLSRYAGINIIENMVDNRPLSDEITNSVAELYFCLKKLDQNRINFPLCKYIIENNNFCIAFQRQFIGKLTKNAYIKGPIKRQFTGIKQAFIKNTMKLMTNIIRFPHQKLKLKRGHLKSYQKEKRS